MSKEQPLRILEVLDNYYPLIDGVINVVDNYAKHLSSIADCEVLVPKYPKGQPTPPYKIFKCISMSGGKYGVRLPLPILDRKLKKHLKENQYDIIHLHSPVTLGKYALKYAKKHNIPTVITIHTMYHDEINRSVKTPFLQRFALNFLLSTIKKCDYIWAVSQGSRDCLHNTYQIDKPCDVVRNGTDYDYPQSNDDVRYKMAQDILRNLGISQDDFVLLTTSRIVMVKKIQLVIDAVAILKERGINVKYVIVGDGDYKAELEKQVKKLHLEDCVIFVGGINDHQLLSAYYLIGDLFCFPSTFDTCGLVVLEAAAMQLPSLVTQGSASSEKFIDGHNGYLAELAPTAYADKISEIIKTKDNLKEIGQNAQKEIYTSWNDVIKIVYNKYLDIVKDYNQNK